MLFARLTLYLQIPNLNIHDLIILQFYIFFYCILGAGRIRLDARKNQVCSPKF